MLNIVLQIISMVLCFVGLLQILVGTKWWDDQKRFYQVFYVELFLYSGLTVLVHLLEGQEGTAVHTALQAAIILRGLVAFLIVYTFLRNMIFCIDPEKKRMRFRYIAHGSFALQVLLFLTLWLSKVCFFVDDANAVHITPWYLILLVMWLLMLAYALYLLIAYRGRFLPGTYWVFWVLSILAIAAIILQMFFVRIHFVSLALSLSVIIFNLHIINVRSALAYQADLELEKLRVDMMLSQIQPHFLFNSLTTIKNLCDTDPKIAGQAVTDFAVYLRGNMDSLSSETLIPFEKELEHTRAYLELEKLRFEDDLTIEEKIACTSFDVPALSLQPLVENAVRHGVRGTEDGKGKVVISTAEYPDRFEMTVSDDGAGFDTEVLSRQEGQHIGISNVRYRLKQMCNGTLTINSTIGQGTEATVLIPKKAAL